MNIESFAKFDPAQYQMFASEDGQRFLEQLNGVLTNLTTALSGKLSTVNFNAEARTVTLEHEVDMEVSLERIRGRVQEVRILSQDLYDFATLAWEHVSERTIKVKVTFVSAPSVPIDMQLLFVGA
jgi:hypothetical protein